MTLTRYDVEFRAEVDGDRIVGHASVFNQMADVGRHWEQVEPGAFDKVLETQPDVRALVNHDPNLVLGRTASGTLRLGVDREGLAFEVDLPDTSYANDLRVLAARGDITGASFGFVPGDDRWSRAPDGRQLRSHVSMKRLADVSIVTYPAYEGASVALRSVDFARSSSANRKRLALVRGRVNLKGKS